MRDLEDDVGLGGLDIVEGGPVGGSLSAEDEIAGGLEAMHQLLRAHGTVVIDHVDTDILHLHVHHPRHDTHDHDGEHDDETRQKPVAPYLQELLMDEEGETLTK